MSGFGRALRAMSREEMLECARGLLACLSGRDGEAGSFGPDAAPAGRGAGGARAVTEAGRARPGAAGAEAEGAGPAGYEGGIRPVERGEYAPEYTQGAEKGGRGASGAQAREEAGAERRFEVRGGGGVHSGAAGGEPGTAWAAAFQGPDRRYENAVGARGTEMGRVSDYFRRDSRRYDAGYARY